jgi:hypothetical protein
MHNCLIVILSASEESHVLEAEILRYTQDDKLAMVTF